MSYTEMLAILAITIVSFLALLHFHVSFGIALIIALGIMAAGVKYMRSHYSDTEENENNPSEDEDKRRLP